MERVTPTSKIKEKIQVETNSNIPADVTEGVLKKEADIKKNRKIKRIIFIFFGMISVFLLVIFLFIYYKNNLSPQAILGKSLSALASSKQIKYNGNAKITFSSQNGQERFELDDIEIYTLIRKSNSDNHEITIQGDLNRSESIPSGNFNLSWSISNQKMFGFEGKFTGYDVLYKASSYPFSGLVTEKPSDEYSPLNMKDLFAKIPFGGNQTGSSLNLNSFGYEVVEVLPSDLINNRKAYHYKVKIVPKDEISAIFSDVSLENWDVWIDKKTLQINKIDGIIAVNNVGIEGNSMNIHFDASINYE